MTPQEMIEHLKQTIKRLEAEQQRWFRKRKKMSDNDNERWRNIKALQDELAALHTAIPYIKSKQ